jgi:hypothetical protein
MMRIVVLLLVVAPLLVSCSNLRKPYQPTPGFEQIEYRNATVGVYPDEIRSALEKYTNTVVALAGIVKDTRSRDLITGEFQATTLVEHHYFDWKNLRDASSGAYCVSPRGEGLFTFTWESHRKNAIASTADVDKYAEPGKLIVVYGIPKRVDTNGVITLSYRYMRVIDAAECNLYSYTYGRTGETVQYRGAR